MCTMSAHSCQQCGAHVAAPRWAKGRRLCLDCTMGKVMIDDALSHLWYSLTLQQKRDALRPFYVDSPEWTALLSGETPSEE